MAWPGLFAQNMLCRNRVQIFSKINTKMSLISWFKFKKKKSFKNILKTLKKKYRKNFNINNLIKYIKPAEFQYEMLF